MLAFNLGFRQRSPQRLNGRRINSEIATQHYVVILVIAPDRAAAPDSTGSQFVSAPRARRPLLLPCFEFSEKLFDLVFLVERRQPVVNVVAQ